MLKMPWYFDCKSYTL